MMMQTPRFMIVLLAHGQAEIRAQGALSRVTFQRLFLDRYELGGERYHPGNAATIYGALLAIHEATLVTVPIWTWTGEDGATRFLCQASEDGSAPALSVFSLFEADLVSQIEDQLRPTGE
jgi:hypothetical protein